MGSPLSTEDVAQDLRLRMISFDHRVQPPPDLFQRVVAPRRIRSRPPQRISLGALVTVGVAALVLAVSLGIGWLARQPVARPAAPATPAMPAPAPVPVPLPTPSSASAVHSAPPKVPPPTKPPAPPRSSAPATGVVMTVFNAETACQSLRTVECGLGVYRDPRNPAADQLVTRVWHGDKVTVSCVVPDGKIIRDEAGVSSTRWYRVTTAGGVTGYLPGVRTRNSTEVPSCH